MSVKNALPGSSTNLFVHICFIIKDKKLQLNSSNAFQCISRVCNATTPFHRYPDKKHFYQILHMSIDNLHRESNEHLILLLRPIVR